MQREQNGIHEVANGVQNGVYANGVANGAPIRGKTASNGHTHSDNLANGNEVTNPQLQFIRQLVDVCLKDGFQDAMDRNNKVCEWRDPEELKAIINYLPITKDSATDEELLKACKDFVKFSVKSSHPRFHNQLFGGMDQYTLGGSWLTDTLNSSQYTFEVAPVFTLIEQVVFKKMLGLISFDGGDAIFTPGGSMANLYGMNVARYHKFPEIKTKGLYSLPKPICLFTSEKGHYSMKKSAATLGLGTDCIYMVKTDRRGKMIPQDLESKIEQSISEGCEPFFINATSGTTVFGAYDPLDQIGDIAQKFGLWLHVDGAWGGSCRVSRSYRDLMKGIEKADSMTWNPHKMMGAPLQCSMFLTKHKGILKDCHCAHARYLFQQDKHYDVSYDTGDMSLQCGRKVDVVKLWMLWRSRGDEGMEHDIDHVFMLSRYLADKMKTTPGYRLLAEPECTNVCFWYIPPSMRGQAETKEWWARLGKVAPVIKERMMKCGSLMIGYQPDGEFVNFFRMVLSNFATTTDDMDFLVAEIDRLGNDL